jgi:hypothetical protein
MWNRIEKQVWSNIAATPASFVLRSGQYALTLHATWGGGSATLQRQTPDGTWVTVLTAITADGFQVVTLPSGTYQLLIATATGLYGDLVSIVVDQ